MTRLTSTALAVGLLCSSARSEQPPPVCPHCDYAVQIADLHRQIDEMTERLATVYERQITALRKQIAKTDSRLASLQRKEVQVTADSFPDRVGGVHGRTHGRVP